MVPVSFLLNLNTMTLSVCVVKSDQLTNNINSLKWTMETHIFEMGAQQSKRANETGGSCRFTDPVGGFGL